ncbi:MAG TPA: ABC transporter substrate-binding protein [Terriglobia bacterium]|nr:ABC transporter substrate-binding protein [Terriglobia bacterium]
MSFSISELAPTGRLRVGINFGNALLANRDARGTPGGIAVDLAQELARRVGLPMELVSYEMAGQMADGAKAGAWDAAFLAADPARAEEITFTAPYLEIETTCLVPAGSPLETLSDVDREGVRVVVSEKSAYDLFLTRFLKRAQLVRAPGVNASVDVFFADKLDALAGLKPLLVEVAGKQPGTRVLDGRFSVVQQAVGVPKGRDSAARYVHGFVEDMKSSGLVASIIEKNGVRGVSVAPLASALCE